MGKKEEKYAKIHVKPKINSKIKDHWPKFAIGAAIVLVVLLALFFLQIGVHKIKVGDTVTVDYTGYLEDGKVFDTSLQVVAEKTDIKKKDFIPLKFTVGAGQVVPGFEENIIGLGKGESKRFIINPDKAYGESNPDLILKDMKRDLYIKKYSNVTNSLFKDLFNKDPTTGDVLELQQVPWKLKVSSIKDGIIFMENLLNLGDKINLPGTNWESDVKEIKDDVITIYQNPKLGDYISFPTSKGMVVGSVSNVDTYVYSIDKNHPLAGKTLTFEVTVKDVIKA